MQGSFLVLSGAPRAFRYPELGYELALAVLPHVAAVVERHLGMPAAVVPPFVAGYFFRSREEIAAEDYDLELYADPNGYPGPINHPDSLFLGYEYFGYTENPGSNFVIGTLAGGERNFQGLEFVFRKRFANRWQLLTSYNWADAEGNILFRDAEIVSDNGAYNGWGSHAMLVAMQTITSMYRVPASRVRCAVVYTNKNYGGSVRGFGNPQATFAIEQQMEEIADALGLDPMDLRLRPAIPADEPFLWSMLFEASHAAEDGLAGPDALRAVPELARYVEGNPNGSSREANRRSASSMSSRFRVTVPSAVRVSRFRSACRSAPARP